MLTHCTPDRNTMVSGSRENKSCLSLPFLNKINAY